MPSSSVLTCLKKRKSDFPFGHNARHELATGLRLYDSYHCSRYNTNTGRLTPEMFEAVFHQITRDQRNPGAGFRSPGS